MSKRISKRKKSVEFSEKICTVVCELPNREDFTPEDHLALWFSKSECLKSRSEAKVISRESVRYGFSKNLDGTFGEKSVTAQERLQLWCSIAGGCRRGLERWANREHGDQRGKEQFQAIQAVLEAQDDMIAAAMSTKSTKNAKNDGGIPAIDTEKLRKVSHKATRTARHFARMLGKADSYAMAHELEDAQHYKKKGRGDGETVATENTSTISVTVSRQETAMATTAGGDDDVSSINSYSTCTSAISSHRMVVLRPQISDASADLKGSCHQHQHHTTATIPAGPGSDVSALVPRLPLRARGKRLHRHPHHPLTKRGSPEWHRLRRGG